MRRPSVTGGPAASEPTVAGWRRADQLIIAAALGLGIAIRLWLLPSDGLRGDIDQFVVWVHHIATRGLGTLYGGTADPVGFGPVMAYVWAALAAVQPAFATVTDAADPGIRILMKLPATIADFGLAAVVAVGLRDRPHWAAIAVAAILLHPVVFYVSAWWGQYESLFALTAVAAILAAINGRNGLAAALLVVSLLTKPQALPFVVPFAGWFWAVGYALGGVRGALTEVTRAALIGIAVLVVLWLPFLAAGGPLAYLEGLRHYQDEVFNALSLNAWNAWWLLQETTPGIGFIADDIRVLGPITLRTLGYVLTGAFSACVAVAIARDPTPRRLIVGATASVLVFFVFMTQMHERYAYAAVVVSTLLLPDRRLRWAWLILGIVVALNQVAAVPPSPEVASLLPVAGILGVTGSVAIIAVTAILLVDLGRRRPVGT